MDTTGSGERELRPLGALLQQKVEDLRQLALLQGEGRRPPTLPEEHLGLVDDDVVSEEGEVGYAARLFAQLALPYRNPGDVARWVRRNGDLTLVVNPGLAWPRSEGEVSSGYPYGIIPRLVVTWMATEAVRTQDRVLHLGPSLRSFLRTLHVPIGGAPAARLIDQIHRLVTASVVVTARRSDPLARPVQDLGNFTLADRARLWSALDLAHPPEEPWQPAIRLSETFFQSVISGPVPIDLEAVSKLRGSALRLDIYIWLVHRLGYLKKPTTVPWEGLAAQFGGDYTRLRAFKAHFLRQLAAVRRNAYPDAKVEATEAGLLLRPSKRALPPRSRLPTS